MICPNCNTNLPEGSRFCTKCGTALASDNAFQQSPQFLYDEPTVSVFNEPAPQAPAQPVEETVQPTYQAPAQPTYEAPVQPQYQAPAQPQYQAPAQPQYQAPVQPQYQAPAQPQYQAPFQPQYQAPGMMNALPMKWYNFLIYFALFFSAIVQLGTAISCFVGLGYGEDTEYVYRFFDGLQGLDIFYGICLIGVAAFQIYVRFQLSGYTKTAPKMINLLYIIDMVLTIIYFIISSIIIDTDLVEPNYASLFITIAISIAMVAANTTYFKKRAHLFVN